MSIIYISRRNLASLVAIVLLVLLQTHTYLLTQQHTISSYKSVNDTYKVFIYDDYNFTAFLSDVDAMISFGEFFGVKVSRGMIEEIIVIGQGGSSIYKVLVEEELKPAIDSRDIIYEFAGYYVKKRSRSSYVQTFLLQQFKGFLRTVCLDTNFTYILEFGNSSKVLEYSTTSVKALILDFKTFVIAFLVETNTTDIVVSEANNSIFIKYISRYPCLSIAGVARFSIEDLAFLLNNISMIDIYRYVDNSKDLYYRYVSALPRLKVSTKIIQDLYYASLYNRLNTLLYPEIYEDIDLSKIANYLMSARILRLSGREFYKTLDKLLTKLDLNNSHYDIFIGLEIAKLLNDKEKLDTICSNAKKLRIINNSIEAAISSKVLSLCGIKDNKEMTTALLLDILPNDILALSELGVVSSSLLQLVRIDRLPTPNSCWECLSYSQAIKLLEPSLTDILLHLRNTKARYTCTDYIVIAIFAGVNLVDNNVLIFTPTIPTPSEILHIVIEIGGSSIDIVYSGWGKEVESVRVNGISVDMTAIPISMLRDKVNTIEIEMARKVIRLEVTVMNNGVPLKGVPVSAEIAQQEAGYNMLSITDDDGKAVFIVKPQSYLVISVNISGIGLLQLRTWVGDRDSFMVIDVSEMLNRLSYVNTSMRLLEERILDLEKSIEAIKSRSTATQIPSQEVSLIGVHNILSSIALSISAITLGIVLINIHRKGV